MENIIELIDHGANVNHVAADDFLAVEGHVFGKTPLFRARSYDIIRFKYLIFFNMDVLKIDQSVVSLSSFTVIVLLLKFS